jgi:hypothetical protein
MTKARRFLLGTSGALVVLSIVAAIVALANGEAGFAGCTIARPFGWIAPIVTASVLAVAGWTLMAQRQPDEGSSTAFISTSCRVCDREVMGQWRMCPYCGAMLDVPSVEPASKGADS